MRTMLNSRPPFSCIARSCASAMREGAKEVSLKQPTANGWARPFFNTECAQGIGAVPAVSNNVCVS
jgi:hypothetical protein